MDLDAWCAWRLMGANNREIARSAHTFSTFHECYQAAREIQQALDGVVTTVRHDDTHNLWAWRAKLDGLNIASSGRLYQRFRECQANVAQFIEFMPIAITAYDAAPARGSASMRTNEKSSVIELPRQSIVRLDPIGDRLANNAVLA
ncbi:MAG TPA: hypothetical protein VGL75_00685 [Acidothermaceae bacterium]